MENREKNLKTIKSIKKHLDVPKRYKDLYYLPDYEKAIVLVALDLLKQQYYNQSDTSELEKSIGNMIRNIKNRKQEYQNNNFEYNQRIMEDEFLRRG